MRLVVKWTALALSAVMALSSCHSETGGETPSEPDAPSTEIPEEEDVVEVEDPTLMTIANFENSFLTFNEGGNLEYSIVTNPRKKGYNTTRRC